MQTIQSILTDMRNAFRAAGLDTPELDARLLVEAALGLDQTDLITKSNQEITKSQENTLEAMTLRRLQREPVSRILGKRAFWKSDFKISPATLDPRPDSETLIEAVLKHTNKNEPLAILDLGTGTGCLLLSLLQELPQAIGTGVDISAEAISIARENAEYLGLTSRVNFMSTDWNKMSPVPFDIVISNPPYIESVEINSLEPEVRAYDPLTALDGGTDGLDCYRDIARLLPRLLKPDGLAFFEIGATQAEAVKGIAGKNGLSVIQTLTDLAGHDRCLIARYT
jgi:release factor glutamine methyltransferase